MTMMASTAFVSRAEPGAPRLSVVIPVRHDDEALARLLDRLAALPDKADEIIVADGGGSRDTAGIATRGGATWLASPPGRGRQLHAGARQASGDVLWFLHADANPPPDAVATIRAAIGAGAVGGCFRFGFEGYDDRPRRLLAALVNLRARVGIPYGDQGLFARRDAYFAAGGFAAEPLFEEIPLVRGLRRAGGFVMLAPVLRVSPRRWERDGWLRRTLANRALALAHALGASPRRLAALYARPLRTGITAPQDRPAGRAR